MASYHFRIKTPIKHDGSSISAREHLLYINREGRYRDTDLFRDYHINPHNYIAGQVRPEFSFLAEGRVKPLYNSNSGSIFMTSRGLAVSDDAAPLVMDICLALASRIFAGESVRVSGLNTFKEACIASAVLRKDTSFSSGDAEIDYQIRRRIREYYGYGFADTYDRRRNIFERDFLLTRGIGSSEGPGNTNDRRAAIFSENGESDDSLFASSPLIAEGIEYAEERVGMPQMSGSDVVRDGRDSGMLLRADEERGLFEEFKKSYTTLRWSDDRAAFLKQSAEDAAFNVVNHLLRSHRQAADHLAYINREGLFENRGGCSFTGSQLPVWANGNSRKFFEAADKLERANGTAYREIEFSLPNELDAEQNLAIVKEFLNNHLKDFYYAFAIHEKDGALSGERHPHVHIMFSEREIDRYEREHGRDAVTFFKRADSAVPERGGCRKADCWNGKDRRSHLAMLRMSYADIQNRALEAAGCRARVDHRSLEDQKKDAILRGNIAMAEILDRLPEEYVGVIRPDDVASSDLLNLSEFRAQRIRSAGLIYARHHLLAQQEEMDYATDLALMNNASALIQNVPAEVLRLDAYAEYRRRVDNIKNDISKLEPLIILKAEAFKDAIEDVLPEKARSTWIAMQELAAEFKNWKRWLDTFPEPTDKAFMADYNAAIDRGKKQMNDVLGNIRMIAGTLRPYMDSIASNNQQRLLIQELASETIASTAKQRNLLKEKYAELDRLALELHAKVEEAGSCSTDVLDIQNTADVADDDFIANSLADLQEDTPLPSGPVNEVPNDILIKIPDGILMSAADCINELNELKERLNTQADDLRIKLREKNKTVISPARARKMAMHKLAGSLYGELRILKDRERKLIRKAAFISPKEKTDLEAIKVGIIRINAKIDAFFSIPENAQKVEAITEGILKRNVGAKAEAALVYRQLCNVRSQIRFTNNRIKTVTNIDANRMLRASVPGISFNYPGFERQRAAANAADRIRGGGVGRVYIGGHRDKRKEWDLLSEFEKDELLNK